MKQDVCFDWWQRNDLCYQNGDLIFAGRNVSSLAAQFGSPSFVYSAKRFIENLNRVKSSLDEAGFKNRHTLYYAMKANRFAPLLTYLKLSGLCGIDACSPNEVEHAVSCGFEPSEISFTATSLSQDDFDMLARYKGLFMDCDSITAIHNWGKRQSGGEIGIRINPSLGLGRSDNDMLQYSGERTTKFGIYIEQFEDALKVAKSYGLKVTKIHFHSGCGYLDSELAQLKSIIERSEVFLALAKDVKRINIGGGLGVPLLPTDKHLNLKKWASLVYELFGDLDIHLEVEPGAYIANDAGLLLLTKTFLEKKQDTLFLGVNAGFNIAPEPAYYELPFQPIPFRYNNERLHPVTVVGNINEALDVWYKDAYLPDMTHHDGLVLINAGAYSSSMASNHCMRGQYKEFLLM